MVISRANLTMRSKSQGGAFPLWRGRLAIPVCRAPVGIVIVLTYQPPQELQLPPPQPAQPPPPPAIGAETPDSLPERQQKLDKARLALCLQVGQSAGSLHLLMGRINSNLVLQSGQIYS
jgi:hypothetical protein